MKRTVTVVLLQDYPSFGKKGDVAAVSYPFAKNLLIPKKIATFASPEALAQAKAEKTKQAAAEAHRNEQLAGLAEKLKGVHITIPMKVAASGKLYGGVKAEHIVSALAQQNIQISAGMVRFPQAIESAGEHKVQIIVGKGNTVECSLTIVPQPE